MTVSPACTSSGTSRSEQPVPFRLGHGPRGFPEQKCLVHHLSVGFCLWQSLSLVAAA